MVDQRNKHPKGRSGKMKHEICSEKRAVSHVPTCHSGRMTGLRVHSAIRRPTPKRRQVVCVSNMSQDMRMGIMRCTYPILT